MWGSCSIMYYSIYRGMAIGVYSSNYTNLKGWEGRREGGRVGGREGRREEGGRRTDKGGRKGGERYIYRQERGGGRRGEEEGGSEGSIHVRTSCCFTHSGQ